MNIDVIIPLYNNSKYIASTLDSVIAQTYKPGRIIVVNDGSTDDGPIIVESYIARSPIPITIITQQNQGLSSARNTGIKASTAPFLAFLDSDDIWKPKKLERQVTKFQETNYKNLALVYCKYSPIKEDGYPNLSARIMKLDRRIKGHAYKQLLTGNKILSSGSGVLIKRDVFDTVGFFDETLRFGEDWDMWLRIAQKYEIDFIDEILVYIRQHTLSMTANRDLSFLGELNFYNKWSRNIDSQLSFIQKFWGYRLLLKATFKLPSLSRFRLIKQVLNKEVYSLMFGHVKGSFILAFLKLPFSLSIWRFLLKKI